MALRAKRIRFFSVSLCLCGENFLPKIERPKPRHKNAHSKSTPQCPKS
jgi:hypothetical protein